MPLLFSLWSPGLIIKRFLILRGFVPLPQQASAALYFWSIALLLAWIHHSFFRSYNGLFFYTHGFPLKPNPPNNVFKTTDMIWASLGLRHDLKMEFCSLNSGGGVAKNYVRLNMLTRLIKHVRPCPDQTNKMSYSKVPRCLCEHVLQLMCFESNAVIWNQ